MRAVLEGRGIECLVWRPARADVRRGVMPSASSFDRTMRARPQIIAGAQRGDLDLTLEEDDEQLDEEPEEGREPAMEPRRRIRSRP